MKFRLLCLLACLSSYVPAGLLLAQSAPGFRIEEFATVTDPLRMTFYHPSGDIDVGRSNNGSGGARTDPVHVHKVGIDGSLLEFGNSPIPGPASVLFDENGSVAPAGSLLVGGVVTAKISFYAIQTNGTVISLFGPSSVYPGPSDMAFDSNQRLVYITETGKLYVSSGGVPSVLVDLPANGRFLAIDSTDRIFTSTADGSIRVYGSAGNLMDDDFANGLGCCTSLAFGSGGVWGNGLYALSDGTLLRFDSGGNSTEIGTNLTTGSSSHLLFHPDGALYISDFTGDKILIVTPEPEQIAPSSVVVTRGQHIAGGNTALHKSDNVDLSISRSSFDVQSRTEFEIKAVSPVALPTSFEVLLEGAVFARSPVNQTIELFDYDAATWEVVDARAAMRLSDSIAEIVVQGDPSRFVEPGTNCIEARIRYQSVNGRQQFSSNTDQFLWLIGR
ncbi:MAG: hypothetical protein AAF456_18725 [Planctomycetota bacterium]